MKENEHAGRILEHKSFREAKTMKQFPHAYTLKREWDMPKQFERVVMFIRENGKREHWNYGKYYIYYYYKGYKYWTMGDTLPNTILINRAKDTRIPDKDFNMLNPAYEVPNNKKPLKTKENEE